jgi:tetratricopeptide (TPR) repeat protein
LAAPEPAVDFDYAEEHRSHLWERVLDPSVQEYAGRVDRARELIAKRDRSALEEAERELNQAIRAQPDHPAAPFLLGRIYAAYAAKDLAREDRTESVAQDWVACAAHAVDLEYAQCSAAGSKYEAAEERLKRILSRGETEAVKVHLLLGEVYMALGRLDEAIEALQRALRLRAPYDPEINFALAVAYDRDEQVARSREHLDVALKREPRFNSLWAEGKVYVPPGDENYYLGLAYLGREELPWALYHFRRFVDSAKGGPWIDRARAHLETARDYELAARLQVKGTATIDRARAAHVVTRADAALQRCVKATPALLLEVRITRYVGVSGAELDEKIRRGGEKPGAKVVLHRSYGYSTDEIKEARSCVQQVSDGLRLPPVTGTEGTFGTVEFLLIAR